ncbi:MAG: ArnT family glycosyltransferase, partial [Paracoccaceae bacterium]
MNTSSYGQNHLIVFLFAILIFIKLALLKHAPLINDEAYTLTIARYFSLSYFDHPPLMTWISNLFHFFEIQKAYYFRIPHIIFGTITSLFLYKIGSLIYSKQIGVFSVIL